jgi:hypothetical protein
MKNNYKSLTFSLPTLFQTILGGFLFLGGSQLVAQNAANYVFSTAPGSSMFIDRNGGAIDMTSGTHQLIGPNSDDVSSGVIKNTLTGTGNAYTVSQLTDDFAFYFMGQRYTSFSVNSNGLMRLGDTPIAANLYGIGTSTAPLLAPFGGNLATSAVGKVHYKLNGSGTQRALVVEWSNMQLNNASSTADGTFQVRLYESTGVVEYVYSFMTLGDGAGLSGYSVGFSTGTSAGQYNWVNTNSLTSATSGLATNTYLAHEPIKNLHSVINGLRRSFAFVPSTPAAPTALAFSSITANSMTLGWTDNSSNESGFVLFRSEDNGVNYKYVTTTAPNVNSYTQNNLIPGKKYFWRIFALAEGAMSPVGSTWALSGLNGSKSTLSANIVLAVTSGNWSNPATWSGGVIPTSNDNVAIQNGVTVTIDNTAAICNNLTIGELTPGVATLEFAGGAGNATLIVNGDVLVQTGSIFRYGATPGAGLQNLFIGGNVANSLLTGSLTVNGTFDMYNAANQFVSLTFCGAGGPGLINYTNLPGMYSNTVISGSGAIEFHTVNINKGNSYETVIELTRSYTASGLSGAPFNIVNGTLRATYVNLTPNFTIPATGGLWLGAGTVSTGAGNLVVNGYFNNVGATLNVGTLQNHSLIMGAGSVVSLYGGVNNIAGSIRVANASDPVTLSITGGTTTLAMVGNSDAAFATFDLGTGASYFNAASNTTTNVLIRNVNSSGSGPRDYRMLSSTLAHAPNNLVTIQLSDGSSPGNQTYYAQGNMPRLIISNTSGTQNLTQLNDLFVLGSFTQQGTGTLDVNNFNLSLNSAISITGPAKINATALNSRLTFCSGAVASINPANLTLGQISNLDIYNSLNAGVPATFTFSSGVQVNNSCGLYCADVRVSSGAFTLGKGSGDFTLNVGTYASTGIAPTMNLGSGTNSINYLALGNNGNLVTAQKEILATYTQPVILSLNNSVGVSINKVVAVDELQLIYGSFRTGALTPIYVTGTTPGKVSGGSAYAFVSGPLKRALPAGASLPSYQYPLGVAPAAFMDKTASYLPFELVNPVTTPDLNPAEVQVSVHHAVTGLPISPLTNLEQRYWQVLRYGASNVSSWQVRLTAPSVTAGSLIGQSTTTPSGAYSSIGGTVAIPQVTSALQTSNLPLTSYYAIGFASPPGAFNGSGTYRIPSEYYKSLSCAPTGEAGSPGIFQAINSVGVTGPVTIIIDGDIYTETGTHALNRSGTTATDTIRVIPDGTELRLVSGSAAGNGMIVLDGANYLTIDGRFGGTGQYLLFRNTGTGATLGLVGTTGNAGAENNRFRNTFFEGSGTGVIIFGGSVTAGSNGNSNNTLFNCDISNRTDNGGKPTHY